MHGINLLSDGKFCPIIADAKERTIGFRRIYPSAMLSRPSNLPHGYIRRRKGARARGLFATLPARPPERGASWPGPPARRRGPVAQLASRPRESMPPFANESRFLFHRAPFCRKILR